MSYFQKSLLHALPILGYLPKLKRGLRLSLGAHSLYFFHKNAPYLILYELTMFQYQTYFPSHDIKECVFLNSRLAN